MNTYKGGLQVGLIVGIVLWMGAFADPVLIQRDPASVNFSILIASISTIITVAILLRPLIRGKSISTGFEGLFSGITGLFDIMGVIIALSIGQLPLPTTPP